jgi:hypothetical protein
LGFAAFGSSLRGTASINSVNGDPTLRGNSKSRKSAAGALAGNAQAAIDQIAEAFGGTVGSFSGSIGIRKKKFVVDPSGRGRTKGSGVLKFDDEAAAQSALLRDAIADGAVQGLSAAVQRAINSNPNIDKALREALKVRDLEDSIAGSGDGMLKLMRDFERQASERLRIARDYGFEMTEIERINATERANIIEQVLQERTGALKGLLTDLNLNNDARSLRDRLSMAQAAYNPLRADFTAGKEVDPEKFAQAVRNVEAIIRELNGSQGAYFDFLEEATGITNSLIKRQEDKVLGATGPNAGILKENPSAPVVSALDQLQGALIGTLNGQLNAVNINLGRVIGSLDGLGRDRHIADERYFGDKYNF